MHKNQNIVRMQKKEFVCTKKEHQRNRLLQQNKYSLLLASFLSHNQYWLIYMSTDI